MSEWDSAINEAVSRFHMEAAKLMPWWLSLAIGVYVCSVALFVVMG